jgi:hypothetical protein
VALPAGIKDARWLRAFHAIVPPLLRAFWPQILVSQHGADTHRLGPLARLEVSIEAQRAAHAAVRALAHDRAGGRWLLTGGRGYALVRVVPRTWTHLLAEAARSSIDPVTPTPAPWRDYVARRTGVTAPEQMTEGEPAPSHHPALPAGPALAAQPPKTGLLIDVAVATSRGRRQGTGFPAIAPEVHRRRVIQQIFAQRGGASRTASCAAASRTGFSSGMVSPCRAGRAGGGGAWATPECIF